MGLDFDALEYCRNVKLQQLQPPYACPVDKCDRSYKSVVGLQYHLLNYDHENPQPLTPMASLNRKKARSRGSHHSTPKTPKGSAANGADDGSAAGSSKVVLNPENLVTYNDTDGTMQFNIHGKSVRWPVDEPIPFLEDEEYAELVARSCILNPDAPPLEQNAPWAKVDIPEAKCRVIDDYNVPDAPPRPLAYYRFIEKSAEELDGEIEYDVDEEDTAWLEFMNAEREKNGLNPVNIDNMELLMDRLEKESYFQAAANGNPTGIEVDDDAVCCICLDGECQNTNVILFCDMCNLAVHQDCYGVPYIPEGQWLCRRCLQSPSTPVNCVLCPNAGGAFKQTDRGEWAHVVCALWIPEVRFANTVFLEPIDSIETIPQARWRLTCYVCKEKSHGACIQCHRNSCYAAFHVTCAQQAGLYMTMDTVNDGHNDSSVHVQKYAYCHAHTPADAKLKTNPQEVEDTRHKMKEARKALAKKRSTAPVVLIPTIPPDRIQEIASMVHMQKKQQFLDRLMAYWTLKRQYRNGVPLLRRLQSQGNHHGVIQRNGIEGSPDTEELQRQLKYWQCLRQDLERARLLCELVRKREKMKAAYVKICEQVVMLQINPLEALLTKLLDALEAKDTNEIFREPVDTDEVPDYLDIVTHPMDLGTMRQKLADGQYTSLEQLETDFDLMIQNCLAYNNKDTVFYRAGIRMRDQAAPLFVQACKQLQREGLLDQSSQHEYKDHVEAEVEEELQQLLQAPTCEKTVQKLLILADKSQVLKNPSYRTKKIKQIRLEIARMRKAIHQKAGASITRNSSGVGRIRRPTVEEPEDEEMKSPDSSGHHLVDDDTKENEKAAAKPLRKLATPKRSRKTIIPPVIEHDDDEEEEEDDDEDEDDPMGEESKEARSLVQTPPCSPIKSLNNSSSPVGVNRRTAVLLTRKAQAALKRTSEKTTPIKEEAANNPLSTSTPSTVPHNDIGSPAAPATPLAATQSLSTNNKLGGAANFSSQAAAATTAVAPNHHHLSPLGSCLGLNAAPSALAAKSPKRNSRHKRLSEIQNSTSAALSPKKSSPTSSLLGAASLVAAASLPTTPTIAADAMRFGHRIPDSFRVYRANTERDVSDSDDGDMSDITGSPCSSCSGFSETGSGSEYDSSDDDDEDDEEDDDEDEEPVERDADDDDGEEDDEEDDDEDGHEEGGGDEDDDDEEDSGQATLKNNVISANGGGGEPMSCSDASGASDRDSDEDMELQTKSAVKRLVTPAQKRPRSASSLKRKLKGSPGPQLGGKASAAKVPNNKADKARSTNGKKQTAASRGTDTPTSVNSFLNSLSAAAAATTPTKKQRRGKTKLNNNAAAAMESPTTPNTDLGHDDDDGAASQTLKPPLEPLQLVWAKCRGYPWYPALILDPKTPKGFVYNGVPLPAPPTDVLALRKNYSSELEVFLVLFFDVKRTWQWLPASKLEILGIDKHLDQQKLVESRKPTERKAVKKAYQDALLYQSQVSDLEGQGPDPIM